VEGNIKDLEPIVANVPQNKSAHFKYSTIVLQYGNFAIIPKDLLITRRKNECVLWLLHNSRNEIFAT
jgi:hypothetical protein